MKFLASCFDVFFTFQITPADSFFFHKSTAYIVYLLYKVCIITEVNI